MKVAICDDDEIYLKKLSREVASFFNGKNTKTEFSLFVQGKQLLHSYEAEGRFDLLFMDIHLMDSDGVDIIKQIRQFDSEVPVIFISSMENRAMDGYDVRAFSFISKQNEEDKLQKVLCRLWEEKFCVNRLAVETSNGIVFIEVKKVLYVESNKRGTMVHTEKEEMETSTSIQNFVAKLPEGQFIESFKSVHVNVDEIKKINTDTLELQNGQILPVSRRNRKDVMFAVMQRLSTR